jgi:vacuolar-type H+-ATPase subunit I/STV1
MQEQLERLGRFNVFPILSISLSVYFFYAFVQEIGVPPGRTLDGSGATYLALAVLFFLLPEGLRFTRARTREYQQQLREAKDEIQELKSETRALMSAYNGLIFSVSNATNHLMSLNTLPNQQDIKEAKKALNAALGEETRQSQLTSEIEAFLNEEDSDFESALWDLRRVIEKELRRILRDEPALVNADGSTRFLSASALFDEFVKCYPNYGAMYNAYHYVLKVCDAALHGREVPESFVHEAFQMGFRMIGALRQIAPAQASQAA